MPGIDSASELSPLASCVSCSPMLDVRPERLAGKVFGHRSATARQ